MKFLKLTAGLMLALLLLPTLAQVQDTVDLTPPQLGDFDPDSVAEIDLDAPPVIPTLTDHAHAIFERGAESGRDPQMFSKVGDSMTASESFLVAFGSGDYDLGDYAELEPVVNFYRAGEEPNAFDRVNYATALGFNTASARDSLWADAEACEANETPLDCEYRLANPAFALIMFGTNDVMFFEAADFDYFLRLIVLDTIAADVVPVLSTFPVRPEEPEKSLLFNQIIIQIADDYDLPLTNLLVALEPLPEYGVNPDDTLHLTIPDAPTTVTTFDESGFEAGYTWRNLVTLQTLDSLLNDLDLLES